MTKPGGTTGLYRGRVMKKKVVCNIMIRLGTKKGNRLIVLEEESENTRHWEVRCGEK